MSVVTCPFCKEDANIDDGFHCNHCGKTASGPEAARAYVEDYLGISEYQTVKDGGDWPISHCDECGTEAFVDYGEVEAFEGGIRGQCFQCGYEMKERSYDEDGDLVSEPRHCTKCGKLFEATDDMSVCPDCFRESIAAN